MNLELKINSPRFIALCLLAMVVLLMVHGITN